MTTAISVKNISKQYKIGAAQQKFQYNMFRDVLVDTLMTDRKSTRLHSSHTEIYTLSLHDALPISAISVKNISKQYKIGAAQQKFQYNMFRDVLVDTLM